MFGKNNSNARASTGGNLSFIGSEVTVTGNIGGKGNLHIEGRVDGDVTCASIVLGSGGQVKGNVSADEARIAGTIEGTIAAKLLAIEASARISGDLSYDAVSVETGAIVEGRVKRLTRDDSGGALKLIANE